MPISTASNVTPADSAVVSVHNPAAEAASSADAASEKIMASATRTVNTFFIFPFPSLLSFLMIA